VLQGSEIDILDTSHVSFVLNICETMRYVLNIVASF
jgi:hypothetical protein